MLLEIDAIEQKGGGALVVNAGATGQPTSADLEHIAVILMRPDGSNLNCHADFSAAGEIVIHHLPPYEIPPGTRLFVPTARISELSGWIG